MLFFSSLPVEGGPAGRRWESLAPDGRELTFVIHPMPKKTAAQNGKAKKNPTSPSPFSRLASLAVFSASAPANRRIHLGSII